MADNIEKTPLGWEINLMFIFLQAVDVIVEDVDEQLHEQDGHFKRELKQAITRYTQAQRKASWWLHDVVNIDGLFWDAVDKDSKRYSNSIADAHEMIRQAMLYMDRSHTETGFYKIMRFLRSLPSGGVFPEEFISRFDFNRAWVYEAGDRVHTTNHGDGTLEVALGNGNWQVSLDSGTKTVLNEKDHFKLL